MSISDSTLRTDFFKAVRDILVDKSPYIENSDTGTTTNASIKSAFNDQEVNTPQIVIYPIDNDKSYNKFGGGIKNAINVVVDCYAANGKWADQLMQQVDEALEENSNLGSGVDLIASTSNYNMNPINENKIHLISTTYTYDRE